MMRYCHECGAEVAKEDIFCLYCGITLQPFHAVSESEEPAPTGDLFKNKAAGQTAGSADLAVNPPLPPEPIEESPAEERSAEQSTNSSKTETAAPLKELPSDLTPPVVPSPAASEDAISAPLSGNLPIPPAESGGSSLWTQTEKSAAEKEPEREGEKPSEIAAPPITATGQSTNNIGKNKVLDEDLQPTLIGQAANLLLASEEEPARVVATAETKEASEEFSKNRFDSAASPINTSEDAVIEHKIAAPMIADHQSANVSPPKAAETIGTEKQSAEPVAQPVVATPAAVEVAVLTPRHTENNPRQETPGSKSPKLKPLDAGTLLNNRYKIVRRIGGGGMGAVYLAEDQNLGGVLRAVKEMIQAYVDESQQEKAVADFRRESVLLTQLEHPSIPTIYDYFFDDARGRFYLVMKYISGGDLAARLRAAPESKLDEGSVTTWAIQIADVLDYLHNRQPPIVYRDLKPSNIMLDGANNKAMLIDFGIARWVNKEEKGVTAVGTMGYAPPELFAGNAEPRSDIYSLGATMFHLLTGADPQSNPLLIFDFTKNPRPRQINLMLSVEMEDILLRSVEYNSGLRFESAAKMRDALSEHLEKLKVGRLTFERSSHNLAQVMPIPAQAPPDVPFAAQPQVNMVFCGFCGEKIIATDMFCAYCGAPQASSAATGARQSANSPSQMQQTMMSAKIPSFGLMENSTARLVVLGTSELDAPLFKLEKENNLVGREDRRANIFPEIDLSKFDNKAQVSRRHARIWREGAAYMIEDLKSSNGTVLITDDNQTVRLQANQPHLLQHGDKLKLGDTMLRFYVN